MRVHSKSTQEVHLICLKGLSIISDRVYMQLGYLTQNGE